MSRRSLLSGTGLAARAFAASRGALALLGVVVLIATTAVSAWPRFAEGLLGAELRYRVEEATPVNRDLLTSTITGTVQSAGGGSFGGTAEPGAVWQGMPGALASARSAMAPALRAVTGTGDYASRSDDATTTGPPDAASDSRYVTVVESYARLRAAAALDAGAWPSPIATVGTTATPPTVDVVLTTDAARLVGWTVGQTRTASSGSAFRLRLSGTVRPLDTGSDFWSLETVRAHGSYVDRGDAGKLYRAVAWVDPGSWTRVAPLFAGTFTQGWFPVAPSALSVSLLDPVRSALGRFLSAAPTPSFGGVPTTLRFSTSLDRTLDAYSARAQPANTLFAILAAGPLGVALAVLVLGVRLLLGRRREALALLAARGASPARLRRDLAIDTALVSVPGAGLGLVAALLLTPGADSLLRPVALALACALAPPALSAAAAGRLGPGDDLRGGRTARRRWGWVLEVLVLGLAALGVAALLQRGPEPASAGLGVDPLLALTPVLLALAACVVVLRVYPVPLSWLTRALRRRRGPVAFIGATSALRSRAGSLWPVFAVVTGVAIAVFSAGVLSTERAGIESGALARVGADLSVTAPTTFTDEQVERLRSVRGVAASAVVEWAGGVRVQAGSQGGDLSGYLVDPAELARVQSGIPEAARVSSALVQKDRARTGAVIGGFDPTIPVTSAILYAGTAVHLGVTEFDFAPGVYVRDAQWVIIDRTALPASAGLTGRPQTVLVSLAPGADAATVHDELAAIAGTGATIGDAQREQQTLRAAPLVAGLETIALLSITLSALMCVGALLLALVIGTASRTRLVATLRTIGYTARQTGALLAWELGPLLVAGLVAGIAVGLALPAIVLAPIDLSGFTGGPIAPAVVVDPLLIAAAAGGFVLVTLAVTLIALAVARRRSPAAVLRAGGEE
ncbi:FtsX-like permease family protein [Leifsonia sp. ZF2019]|uniref:ABC transporter permease n=1 Tax=Leifsonia sp. ZF2019 TaxID=2781978 RepID=UPI001CBAB72A|nr:FtsX-like permease family protein [Leifsonia sp. ZF2019]UAJ78233.1 FtsX-like permease family protein [Leifsonia sp. ZF2019]